MNDELRNDFSNDPYNSNDHAKEIENEVEVIQNSQDDKNLDRYPIAHNIPGEVPAHSDFHYWGAHQSVMPDMSSANHYYQAPNQQTEQKVKKRKGRTVFNVVKLTASAVAFGLIAGIVFQSYISKNYPTQNFQIQEKAVNELKPTETLVDNQGVDNPSLVSMDTVSGAIVNDVSNVVENVMPSIVAINASAVRTGQDFFGRRIEQPVEGSGSGIIIGQNGSEILIVTNNHVIDGAQQVQIVFSDDTTANATVKGTEPKSDLAVVAVDINELSSDTASTIKVASLGNSNEIKAGSMAIAIGNALGYGQSVTVGYVSALNREITIEGLKMTLLQTDAAINPGNSGGALLNLAGEVIGINSVKFASAQVEGMGYAIPISDAIPIINDLMKRETIDKSQRGFLGIDLASAQEVTDALSKRFSMPLGIFVNAVIPGSPAEKAGLVQGNIIVGINNKSIETVDDLINALTYLKAGEEITLVINAQEDGTWVEKELQITLSKRPD